MGNSYFTAVPEQVGVEITNRCDLACRHCFNKSGRGPVQELSIADLRCLFDQLQEMGIKRIRISGGEPTLHPQFAAVVTEAYRKGLRVTINSHGLYSSRARAEIAVLPIDCFIVSLDGLQAVNDSIRGPGVFHRVVETAAWLLGMNRPVTLGVHLTRSAVGDIPGLIALAAELGAGIKFAPLRLMGRAEQYLNAEMLSPADFYRAVQTITRLRTEHPEIQVSTDMDILRPVEPSQPVSPARASCPAGRTMLNVNYDGYVYPCAFLVTPGREFAAGHLHDTSLLALWRDSTVFVPFRTLERDAVCQRCFAYGQACVGGCVALSYLATGRLDARDPTCFADLLSSAGPEEA